MVYGREAELEDRKLRIEDAKNTTFAAVEEVRQAESVWRILFIVGLCHRCIHARNSGACSAYARCMKLGKTCSGQDSWVLLAMWAIA